MDWDKCLEIEKNVCDANWFARARLLYDEQLPAWLSNRHPHRHPCRLKGSVEENISCGSFNWVFKADFPDGECWAVRFPRESVAFRDAKVEAEVAAITLIRDQTDIPVPKILDWGLASANELGLGPFIISEFVEGIQLADQLTDPYERLFKEDISEDLLCNVFRQIARFMLQLSKIEFPAIGGLSSPANCSELPIVAGPPITLKAQDLMQLGGIDRIAGRSAEFSSSLEYFEYLADGDIVQLHEQRNSVDDPEDATEKYKGFHTIKQLVPRFCQGRDGPFKLICDDFGPFNMLVRSNDDPTIVAVIDCEYSYAGPFELFWSPPRWLIGQLPKNWNGLAVTNRYLKHLEIYIRMMEEVEREVLSTNDDSTSRPSSLIRRATKDGSMWFYHILREAFNGPDNELFRNLRRYIPAFDSLAQVPQAAVQTFVDLKVLHLREYEQLVQAKEKWFDDWLKQLGKAIAITATWLESLWDPRLFTT